MKRIREKLVAAGLVLAVAAWLIGVMPAGVAWADDAAATTAAATTKDAKAEKSEAEAAKTAKTIEAVTKAARDYLVMVSVRWQKDQGELPPTAIGPGGRTYSDLSSKVDEKSSTEVTGVVMDASKGLVMTADFGVEPRYIEKVRGYTAEGKEFPLEPYGFYMDMDRAAWKSSAWPGVKAGPEWAAGPISPFGERFLADLDRVREGWEVSVSAGGGTSGLLAPSDAKSPGELLLQTEGGLVFDGEARPLGLMIGPRVSLVGERFPWRGTDIDKARMVTLKDFEAAKEKRLEGLRGFTHPVKIVYRQPEENEDNLEFEGEDPTSLTQYYYGYAVTPTRIFVPVKMEKVYIQRFKRITVQIGDTEVPAEFMGAYLNFGGFLVQLVDGQKSPTVLPTAEAAPLPDVARAMLTYLPERRFGRLRETLWYNRIESYEMGYDDRLWPKPARAMQRGTLVETFDGRPIALCLVERRPEQEKKGQDSRWRYYRSSTGDLQLYLVSELAEAFGDPEKHFDPNLRPTNEQEEKRMVWLGVETQPVTTQLAEMLDENAGSDLIRKATRNGEVGLRVTWVYRHSPAAEAGIETGDILLEITEKGKTEPIELKPDSSGSSGYYFGRRRYSSGSSMTDRNNFLTKLLTRLGPGTEITLTYIHESKKTTHDFKLSWAPYDNDSANKYKDEKTGLTVKDLTYDIRAMFRLEDDQPGVIVAKVEDGQKASVAQIGPGIIITEINGKPVRNVEEYEKTMKAVQAGETGTAVMKLMWMGKNAFVKIEFP